MQHLWKVIWRHNIWECSGSSPDSAHTQWPGFESSPRPLLHAIHQIKEKSKYHLFLETTRSLAETIQTNMPVSIWPLVIFPYLKNNWISPSTCNAFNLFLEKQQLIQPELSLSLYFAFADLNPPHWNAPLNILQLPLKWYDLGWQSVLPKTCQN